MCITYSNSWQSFTFAIGKTKALSTVQTYIGNFLCMRYHYLSARACMRAVTSPEFPLTLAQPDPACPAESEEEPVCRAHQSSPPPAHAHCYTIHQIGVVHHVCRQVVSVPGRVRHLYTDSDDHRGYLHFIRRVARFAGQ